MMRQVYQKARKMIAIDTSALVAILLCEPEAEKLAQAIQSDEEPLMSAASLVELYLVMKYKQGTETKTLIDELIKLAKIKIIPVTAEQAQIAIMAGYQFSALNYGDTFSYALAKDFNIDLLFKGNDFSQTDIGIANY
jgi:ribonuclease VapC